MEKDSLVKLHAPSDFDKLLFERQANRHLLNRIEALRRENSRLQLLCNELEEKLREAPPATEPTDICMDYKRRYELIRRKCTKQSMRLTSLRDANKELISKMLHRPENFFAKNM